MPTVILAAPLARWLPPSHQGVKSFLVEGGCVRECLADLFTQVPQLRGYVLDDQGALRHHVAAFVDSHVVRDKQTLQEPVPPGGEIFLMQALSGG